MRERSPAAGVAEAERSLFAPDRLLGRGSFFQQVKLARFWLPLAIVGVVLVHQLFILPLGGAAWRFWASLLFYAILGPVATYLTLDWIASQVRARETAQNELRALYTELQASHALLGAIQKVTEQFASAPDLEATLSAASRGLSEVTGALGAAVLLRASGTTVTQSHGLSEGLVAHAVARDEALRRQDALSEAAEVGGTRYWLLSSALLWSGRLEGSVHAYYPRPPSSEQRESFSILASELSAAAEAARSRGRDLLTLLEVDRSIHAEGNLERLLEALLAQMMARADASMGGVYLADEADLLRLSVTQGVPKGSPRQPLRAGEGFVGAVAQAAEPRIATGLTSGDKAGAGGVLERAESAVALPLLADEGLLGVVVLAHHEAGHFSEAALPFLSLLAGQVSLAVRNARAYLHSEELAIAEERARIAREIHDGVAQSLAFSALKLDLVTRLLASDPAKAEAELAATKGILRELIKEVRRSIFALRPIDLEHHGFTETIRRYCHDYGQQNNLRVQLELGELPQLSLKSEAVLFRIFQEAMNNVAKHASASAVTVRLGSTAEGWGFVAVADDGRGFDPEQITDRVTSAGGLGLRQMRERVEARGGRFRATSAPGAGTEVFAAVPD